MVLWALSHRLPGLGDATPVQTKMLACIKAPHPQGKGGSSRRPGILERDLRCCVICDPRICSEHGMSKLCAGP